MRAALLQITSSDDPDANLGMVSRMVAEAAGRGAEFVLTPEVTNCLSFSRAHQNAVLRRQDDDPFLAGMRAEAGRLGIWLLLGSLALRSDPPEERFANRSVLISPEGEIAATYDKMHMFDVQVSESETYRESAGYRPGDRAVLARTPLGAIGLSVCYDVRFAYLYRKLAQAGAQILTVPAAFSPATGPAHWGVLLRARAIETGCFVLAPAQCGRHPARQGRQRSTYGHSLAVAPWGEVLVDGGTEPGCHIVDLDLSRVAEAREKIPSLQHDRQFSGPQ